MILQQVDENAYEMLELKEVTTSVQCPRPIT